MIDISRITYEHYPLNKVLMHRPGEELKAVTEDTLRYFNFAAVPDPEGFQREFDALADAFRQMGSEVVLVNEVLKDDEEAMAYISKRANMTYTRDLALVTPKGGILLGMAIDGRKGDPAMIGRVFDRLGIPRLGQLEPEGLLEGGGISYFRGDTVIVGRCSRTNAVGLQKFEALMKQAGLKRMVTIPCHPGAVHIDGFLVFIDQDLAIVHPPSLDFAPALIKDLETGAVREQMMLDFLNDHDVEMITITEDDGWAAANFVMTRPRHIVGYEWAERVMNEVEKRGGKAIGVPGKELRKGNGGPHCMTCALERGRP
jgi:N-dimethylarginine dimethylaminohydrolase